LSRCRTLVSLIAVLLASGAAASGADRRPISLDDLARLREVSDPQISPDGNWVAYTVASEDQAADQEEKHVWMTSWDGTQSLRLTAGKDEESLPRWSPDGKFLAFLSDRGDESEAKQLWLMALQGGEAEKITDFKGGVTDLDWSPDGKRLVLVVDDPDPDAPEKGKEKPVGKAKTKKPIVIDRFQFKEDETGYLTKARSHLYLFDRETLKSEALTSGGYDERLPAWSPDGKAIAFVSKRGPDFDRTENWDVFSIEPRAGAVARQLTTFEGPDEKPDWESRPAWSPDGRWVAYLEGGPARLIDYAVHKLAVVPAAGGPPRILTPDLDRNVTSPRFSRDGASILFLLEDDRVIQLARVPFGGGAVDRVVSGRETVTSYTVSSTGRVALLLSTAVRPDEVFALDGAEPRPLSRQKRVSRARTGRRFTASWSGPPITSPGAVIRRCCGSTADRCGSTMTTSSTSSNGSGWPPMATSSWPPTRAAARAGARSSRSASSPTGATRTLRTCSPRWTTPCGGGSPTPSASASAAGATAAS